MPSRSSNDERSGSFEPPRTADVPLPVEGPSHAVDQPGAGTILVVEDAPSVRALLVRLLTEAGYHVLEAPDAGSALDILRGLSDGVDLLLTDVVLPDTSGPELVASLEDEQPALPVIYMSGYTDDAIVHHGVLAEGTSFIERPFRARALLEKVRHELALRDGSGSDS